MTALAVAWVIVLLDQITKHQMMAVLVLGQSRPLVPGFFSLTHVRNTGAVWGVLQQHNDWLVFFSIGALLLFAVFRRWMFDSRRAHQAVLGLMIGGVLGNLVDRVRLGWVVDFLDFHLAGRHWPAFNVADAAICVGVAAYMLLTWREARRSPDGARNA